jgi:hypothetical protein
MRNQQVEETAGQQLRHLGVMQREIERLRRRLQVHRNHLKRLLDDAEDYTHEMDCVFCGGMEGYESAHALDGQRDTETGDSFKSGCP